MNGILFDLGLSSLPARQRARGFSFQREAPLDMRFGPEGDTTASYWVNEASEEDLADVIWRFGEETASRKDRPRHRPRPSAADDHRTSQSRRAGRGPEAGKSNPPRHQDFPGPPHRCQSGASHPERRVASGPRPARLWVPLVVISYHSLEDRIVKQFIARESRDCICPPRLPVCTCGHKATLRPVTRGALAPSPEEVAANPRARSAKLRAAERLAAA